MAKVKYKSSGIVYGHFWGGGKGGYSARKFEADSKEELIKKCNEALEDGSLDSGMGYESLIGALINIEIETTIKVKGKEFTNKEYELEFIGNLTEEEGYFLEESISCFYSICTFFVNFGFID